MTGGQIAALIAAGAFAVLVIFLIIMILKAAKVLSEVARALGIITQDVDVLAREVEGLLGKTNVLLDDVNGKVANLDPVFKAAGDLGESVSSLNTASRQLTQKVSSVGKTTAKAGVASSMGRTALKFYQKSRKNKGV